MAEKVVSKLKFILKNENIFTHPLKFLCYYKLRKKVDNYSDEQYLKRFYKCFTRKKLDINNPRTFNEKIQWLKLYWRDPLAEKCSDKLEVKNWIREKGLGKYLPTTFGVFNQTDEIDFTILPEQFVIKTTHDSGGVYVVKEKNEKEIKKAIRKINNALKRGNFAKFSKEWVYENIKPRIIIEELIVTDDGKSPRDIKFFCFHGKPEFLFVGSQRDEDIRFDFFTLNWVKINVFHDHLTSKQTPLPPPKWALEEMISIATQLSKPFPHVRVDFYFENNKIYIGELTFFHNSGIRNFYPNIYDVQFGSFLDLKKINAQNKYS